MADNLNNDRAITSAAEDRFNRAGFAKKIALLCAGKTPESRVIGIYGKWGDGKSSLMNMVRTSLPDNTIRIEFNPWMMSNEQELLHSFFSLFAQHLGGSITLKSEKIKKAIADYGESIGVLGLIPGASPFIGAIKHLPKLFFKPKVTSPEDAKNRVKNLLIESGVNVTVFIDDIDRLDNKEVKAVFKLVKLLADFPRTTYILALDPDIVARMLAPDYGGQEIEYGYKYLEKLIQLPLNIPMVHDETAAGFLNNALLEISADYQLHLENEREKLADYYADGLLTLLDNPRKIIRVCNSLKFALPILKYETDIIDLIVIETLKVTAPELYQFIRSHRELMTDYYLKESAEAEADRKYARSKITAAVSKYSERNMEAMRKLTCLLFPNFAWQSPAAATGISPESADISRRICSPAYFDRYFTFSLLPHEIADARFREIYLDGSGLAESDIARELEADIKRYSYEQLAYKFAGHRHSIQEPVAEKLIAVFCSMSDRFERSSDQLANVFQMMVLTTEGMIKKFPTIKQFQWAMLAVEKATNLNFAADVAARFIMPESTSKKGIYFSEIQARQLKEAYLKKLKQRIEEAGFFEAVPESRMARQLVWWHDTDPVGLKEKIDIELFINHLAAIKLLRVFTPTLISHNKSGYQEIKANFNEEAFALLDRVIGAQKIMLHLSYLNAKAIENFELSDMPGLNEALSDEQILFMFNYHFYKYSDNQNNGSGLLRKDD